MGLNAKTQGGGLVAGWVGVGAWLGGSGGGYLSCLMTSYVQTIANSNDPSTSIRKKCPKNATFLHQPYLYHISYIGDIINMQPYVEGDGDIIKHIGSATVTIRITFLVGNPNEPSFATVTGWGG